MEQNPEIEECKCQSRELQALQRRVVSSSLNFFVFSIFRRRKSLLTLRRQKNRRVTRISESPNQVSRSQVRHISRYFALNRRSKLFSNEPGIVEATRRNCNAQILILESRDLKWYVLTFISIRVHFYASQTNEWQVVHDILSNRHSSQLQRNEKTDSKSKGLRCCDPSVC